MSTELVAFFKALAETNRLKIVGLLAHKPYSVEQLAAILHLRPSTVSHHLAKLAQAGLVSARAESYYNMYQLEPDSLQKIRTLFSQQDLKTMVKDVDLEAYDRKVIEDLSRPDGGLKTIPSQRKKLEAVLHFVLSAFDPGVRYSEEQVNERLARFHNDTATLRRELIAFGLLHRKADEGSYWRNE